MHSTVALTVHFFTCFLALKFLITTPGTLEAVAVVQIAARDTSRFPRRKTRSPLCKIF